MYYLYVISIKRFVFDINTHITTARTAAARQFFVPVVGGPQPVQSKPAFILEGVLGRPQGASVRAPRPLLQVLRSQHEHSADDEAVQLRSARAVRLAVEECINQYV